MGTVKALRIDPPPPAHVLSMKPQRSGVEVVEIEADLESLQAVVGGDIECINLFSGDNAFCYVNTNGSDLPTNRIATMLVTHYYLPGFAPRDRIAGVALFLGVDEIGNETDVPEHVITQCRALAGLPLVKREDRTP